MYMSSLPVYDLCSLSEFRHNDILISRFAPYLKNHHKLRLPHRHTFYHLVLFTEGSGNHTVDFQQFPVEPFQIYFMIPGQVHSWDFIGEADGYILNFTSSLFQSFLLRPDYLDEFSFFRGNTKDSVIQIPKSLQSRVYGIFEELLTIKLNSAQLNIDKFRVLMLELFILIEEANSERDQSSGTTYNITVLKNFQKLIEKHYTELRLPKEYAELLYITPNHLNALCSEMLGTSAGELIRNRINLEAKRLLVNLDLQISEIAFQLNFKDNSYFSKFFKKQEGCTPDEFRKKVFNINKYETIGNQ